MKCFYLYIFFLSIASVLTSTAGNASSAVGPLQLAEKYQGNVQIEDYFASEKLDGIRARWTGTVLLTRNGNRIYAPPWFTNDWPDIALDGELWTKHNDFQRIASIVLSETPDNRWRNVKMMVFDMPMEGERFEARIAMVRRIITKSASQTLEMIPQFTLFSEEELERRLDRITQSGGEGIMLHHRRAIYKDGRSNDLLKVKRYQDAEANVIAHLPGKGKYSDMMGALLVRDEMGSQFKIGSGFTDAQRRAPPPIGSWVTFKYYGRTRNGIPRFATYLHVRSEKDR